MLTTKHKVPNYRQGNVFATFNSLNCQYMGWAGNPSAALSYMEQNPDTFIPQRLEFSQAIANLESLSSASNPATCLFHMSQPYDDGKKRDKPLMVNLYGSGSLASSIVGCVRDELTRQLVALLPEAKTS